MNTDIGKLYGVGSAKKAAYGKLGIYIVEDIISHYPRGYEDRGSVKPLCDADGQSKSSHILLVATEPRISTVKGRMSLLKFKAYDESGVCEITFFNQNYLKSVFSLGSEFRFYGKVEKKGSRYYMSSPAYEPIPSKSHTILILGNFWCIFIITSMLGLFRPAKMCDKVGRFTPI